MNLGTCLLFHHTLYMKMETFVIKLFELQFMKSYRIPLEYGIITIGCPGLGLNLCQTIIFLMTFLFEVQSQSIHVLLSSFSEEKKNTELFGGLGKQA